MVKKNLENLKLETMINHAKSATSGAKKSLVVVDMPKDSYKNSKQALKNAKHVFQKAANAADPIKPKVV